MPDQLAHEEEVALCRLEQPMARPRVEWRAERGVQ
jgi:hypothetical protein